MNAKVRLLRMQRDAAWIALHRIETIVSGSPLAHAVRKFVREAVQIEDWGKRHKVITAWEMADLKLPASGPPSSDSA